MFPQVNGGTTLQCCVPIPILSVRQPWANSLVFGTPTGGFKDVECRSWRTNYRGRLWIHAAKQVDQRQHALSLAGQSPDTLPRGVVIGSVRLVDVVATHTSRWASPSDWYWCVVEPEPLQANEFVPVRGMPGLFYPSKTLNAEHAAILGRHDPKETA